MNNKGKAGGLVILIILVAALAVAYLVATQMGSIGKTASTTTASFQEEGAENPVDAAKEAVDALNQLQEQVGLEP